MALEPSFDASAAIVLSMKDSVHSLSLVLMVRFAVQMGNARKKPSAVRYTIHAPKNYLSGVRLLVNVQRTKRDAYKPMGPYPMGVQGVTPCAAPMVHVSMIFDIVTQLSSRERDVLRTK